MACSITSQKDNTIQVQSMRDGELAVITQWGEAVDYIGCVIQRVGKNRLVTIGEYLERGWSNLGDLHREELRVRLLEPGDIIRVDKIKTK